MGTEGGSEFQPILPRWSYRDPRYPLSALQGRLHLPDLDGQPRARHEEEDGNQGSQHVGDFDGNYVLHQETQVECHQVEEDPVYSQNCVLLTRELFRLFMKS